jgi:predicted metalloendopeptidase
MPALTETNRERMVAILENASSAATPTKMGDLYASCMNTAAIDARGLDPLKPDFDRIAQAQSIGDFAPLLADMQRIATIGMSPTSSVVVGPFHLISGIAITTLKTMRVRGRSARRLSITSPGCWC